MATLRISEMVWTGCLLVVLMAGCAAAPGAETGQLPVTVVVTATATESDPAASPGERPQRRAEVRPGTDRDSSLPPSAIPANEPLPVSPTALPPPTARAGSEPSSCGRATVVGVTALSIRAAPTRQSERIGEVLRGRQVELVCVDAVNADDRRWLRVRVGGIEGWMSDRYLETGAAATIDGCGRATVVGVTALAIRSAPSRRAAMLAEVGQGQQVVLLCVAEVAADDRIWWRVRDGAIEGWMSNRYLQREEE